MTKFIKNKVGRWYDKLKKIKRPCVYIITRNNIKEMNNLYTILNQTEWNDRKAVVYLYTGQKKLDSWCFNIGK